MTHKSRADRTQTERTQRIAFACIRAVHDGWLMHRLVDPAEVLTGAGLRQGDTVFEIGCGPGFFTLAASQVVGPGGQVFAYDVNPYAVAHVQEKAAKLGLSNVTVRLANAAESGLPANSVDFAFLFGVPRIADGLCPLVAEVARVLRPGGTFTVRTKSRNSDDLQTDVLARACTSATTRGCSWFSRKAADALTREQLPGVL